MAGKYSSRFFSPKEFERCVPSCSIDDMRDDFLCILDWVRDVCGFPIILNSAYRSKDYELSQGRDGSSSHTKGIAVDIRCSDSMERASIIDAVCNLSGFMNFPIRIGIGKNYLHFDIDSDKPQCIWLY